MKTETVTRVRAGARDRSGKAAGSSDLPIPGVVVVPRRGTESTEAGGGEIILGGYKLFFPRGADVKATDTFTVRGEKNLSPVGRPADFGKRIMVIVDATGAV